MRQSSTKTQTKKSPTKPNSILPERVLILGRPVTVRRPEMAAGDFGEYHQHQYLIDVAAQLEQESAERTLVHECLHAALHISGISEMIPRDEKTDLEEALVVCLENALGHAVDLDKLRLD